ncbi:MAG: peptidoglycan DD-metalloendopeptidase family protein [Gammaproteobacteria bacterium]|nr:peptidoglycan DD-metalloendopeptidase family protein [Gammaproteobacteria bacterium]MBQ0840800.1 peptidoglycan DD-metalloendopeptidase family protein [Gammaproteobacteria bacterium]
MVFSLCRRRVVSSWAVFVVACCLLLAGCGSTPAPVSSRTPPPSQKIRHHIVGQGDTLFAIAWRYELSIESLARANGLSRPYDIYAGQRLMLDMSRGNFVREKRIRSTSSRAASTSAAAPKKVVRSSSSQPGSGQAKRDIQPKVYALPQGKLHWQWPVKGSIARRYDTNRIFKGLNIQSAKGRKVGAAAPGVVVYAGRGLRGYGQLLIIKHSETYLSAYAHNRKMYVQEGQKVAAGQKISEVGGDPENSGRLYFEIRKNGKPVDPMRLLPRL